MNSYWDREKDSEFIVKSQNRWWIQGELVEQMVNPWNRFWIDSAFAERIEDSEWISHIFFCFASSLYRRKRLNKSFYSLCNFFSGWSISSDTADLFGIRLEFMKEGQHYRNKSADWSELSRIHYPRRILTPTKFRRWT